MERDKLSRTVDIIGSQIAGEHHRKNAQYERLKDQVREAAKS